MAKNQRTEIEKRVLPRSGGWTRKFSSFLRFQQYRPDEVSVSSVIVALDGTGDFDDIQAAHDSLPDTGGRIIIKNGNYNITSRINITKESIEIQGSGKSTNIVTTADIEMIRVTAVDNFSISDVLFTGPGAGNTSNYGIRLITSNYSKVDGCWFTNVHNVAIAVNTNSGDCVVTNNVITGSNNYAGITTDTSARSLIQGNKVTSSMRGIIIDSNATECTVITNTCSSNIRDGIEISRADNNLIIGNTCNNNDSNSSSLYSGILLSNANSNRVENNYCVDNDAYGITILTTCNGTIVTGNIIATNGEGTIKDLGTNTQIGHNITDRPIVFS